MISSGVPNCIEEIAGIKGTVALFKTEDGTLVATLDENGNLGLLGQIFMNDGQS